LVLISIPCILKGGTEFQTLQLVRALIELKQQVVVVCYHEHDPDMVSLFEKEGAKTVLLQFSRKTGAICFVLAFAKYLRKSKPSVVHIQYMAPGALPIFAAVLARIPRIIATVHQPFTKSHGWKAKYILRFAALFCDPFLSVSQNAARSWFGKTSLFELSLPITKQAKQLTIYNTIDVKKIQDLIKKNPEVIIPRNIDVKHPIIGAVARLSYEKGIDILIQAFSRVQKMHPNTQLLLVGDGSHRKEYEILVKRSNLEQSVFFYGAADWNTAMHLMFLMNIVVVPSRFEGFGLTAAEGMAMGKPVIASDTFGLKELITHGESGLLFENENHTDLANKLLQLLSDINLSEKLSKVGYEKALKNFDYPVFERNIRCLYNL
jgi:glycosyltransferase involved in cell wall biosynthesis